MAARKQASYQIISTRMHGMMDIGVVLLLLVLPFALGFADFGPAHLVMLGMAFIIVIASLMTRFEFGIVGIIPMPMHLMLDVGAGLLLAASPWLLGFYSAVYLPHLLVGLAEIGAAVMTKTQPQRASMMA
jgi:hypothetical protein